MSTLTYHITEVYDTYSNILANMDQYQLGFSSDTFGSVGVADDLIYMNDTASGEHYTIARQFKIANDDTTVSYCSNNFGATTMHNYLTLINDSAEDTDEGRESRISFKGIQSGTEETTLARIEARHDGSSDDQNGELVFSINDGNDSNTPSLVSLKLDSNGYVEFGALNNAVIFQACATAGAANTAAGYMTLTAGGLTRYINLLDTPPA